MTSDEDDFDFTPAANQLALVQHADAADERLIEPAERNLRRRVAAGTTRRRGCGVCRNCLFAPKQARSFSSLSTGTSVLRRSALFAGVLSHEDACRAGRGDTQAAGGA